MINMVCIKLPECKGWSRKQAMKMIPKMIGSPTKTQLELWNITQRSSSQRNLTSEDLGMGVPKILCPCMKLRPPQKCNNTDSQLRQHLPFFSSSPIVAQSVIQSEDQQYEKREKGSVYRMRQQKGSNSARLRPTLSPWVGVCMCVCDFLSSPTGVCHSFSEALTLRMTLLEIQTSNRKMGQVN